MEKEFVKYNQALSLKELGFDKPCFGDYYKFDNNDIHLDTDDDRHRIITDNKDEVIIEISAPLYQQAFRWFREKHKLNNYIVPYYDYYYYLIKDFNNDVEYQNDYDQNSYEEAEQSCLIKLIEIVKNK